MRRLSPRLMNCPIYSLLMYRQGLFFCSTKTAGGRVDFDYYRIGPTGDSR